MTWRHQEQVWKIGAAAGLSDRLRLFLLACGNHATKDGRFWPSNATLVRETGLDRRLVWRFKAALLAMGWIRKVEARIGRGKTHVYRLFLPPDVSVETILAIQKEVQSCTSKHAKYHLCKTSERGTKRTQKEVQNVCLPSTEPKYLTVRQGNDVPPSAVAAPRIPSRHYDEILQGTPPPGLRDANPRPT